MLYHNPTLTEQHFIESYISGLKEKLVPFIDLSHPTTLEEVYKQAKLHEQALSIVWRKSRMLSRTTSIQIVVHHVKKPVVQEDNTKSKTPKNLIL